MDNQFPWTICSHAVEKVERWQIVSSWTLVTKQQEVTCFCCTHTLNFSPQILEAVFATTPTSSSAASIIHMKCMWTSTRTKILKIQIWAPKYETSTNGIMEHRTLSEFVIEWNIWNLSPAVRKTWMLWILPYVDGIRQNKPFRWRIGCRWLMFGCKDPKKIYMYPKSPLKELVSSFIPMLLHSTVSG